MTVEEIETSGYRLEATLDMNDIVPFVKQALEKNTPIKWAFHGASLLSMLACIMLVSHRNQQGVVVLDTLGSIGLGVLLAFLLIPLHEYIHGLAYRSLGARDIRYTANWRKFYFTAQAHRFVVDAMGFYRVAFAPFLLITASLLLAMILLPAYIDVLFGALLMHTLCCGGDFALASYFYQHRRYEVLTYDDCEKQEAYFYLRSP